MTPPNFLYPEKTLKTYLGSALLLLYMIVSTLLTAPVVLACALLPFPVRYTITKTWAGLLLKVAEATCGVRYKIEGLEHVDPKQAAVLMSNHQSAWETIAFRYVFPVQTSLFKKSLLWIPLWGWSLATLKPIAIDRTNKQSALRKLIKNGSEALKEGLWVVVFPEGTRMPVGKLKDFSAGGAMLAQKSGFPVVPVAHNAGRCWPRYSFIKYPGTITVRIGAPIPVEGRKVSEINNEAQQWIEQALREFDYT